MVFILVFRGPHAKDFEQLMSRCLCFGSNLLQSSIGAMSFLSHLPMLRSYLLRLLHQPFLFLSRKQRQHCPKAVSQYKLLGMQ